MRAIRVHTPGGPEVLQVEDIAAPVPKADEVIVKLEAIGINFIDVYHRSGLYPVPTPFTPGREGAGTVVEVGANVTAFRSGDRVAYQGLLGAYAEYAAVPESSLVPIPEGVSFQEAASLMLQGMTAHYLATSTYPLKPGDSCLIHAAAGGVGLLLCQLAAKRGAHVIGTVSTPEKAELATAAGAHDVINYTTHDFESEVKRLTHNRGVHVVYDSVGRSTFEKSLNSLAPRGFLVLFGQSSGPVPPFDPQVLNRKGSLFLTRPTLDHYVATREELLHRASDLFAWIREGKLTVRIHQEFPLSQAAEAHRALESRSTTGKLLLIPED
jgi:NADPH2:quinone reductase